jgi:predicted nucleic acid-binding protein
MEHRTVYADTSFLLSHHLNDEHTDRARFLIGQVSVPLRISRLGILEYHTSLWRKVGADGFSRSHAERAIRFFERQIDEKRFVVCTIAEGIVHERAKSLAAAYSSELKVRSLDILHVACALEMGVSEVWTFDERQKRLAAEVGLRVNP